MKVGTVVRVIRHMDGLRCGDELTVSRKLSPEGYIIARDATGTDLVVPWWCVQYVR